jgi:hypothetical protein
MGPAFKSARTRIGNKGNVRLALLFVSVATASLAAGQAAPPADQREDESLTRVATALAKPPSKLVLQERKPDFIVDIRERERFEHLLPPMWEFKTGPAPWAGASSGWSQPIVSVELLSIFSAIAKSVASARRAHAADAAREEVRREIANYCLAQPNGGAGLQICATSPAMR